MSAAPGSAPVAAVQQARGRVERLLSAARRLADPADAAGLALRGALLETTALSAAGIELALQRTLELQPSQAELAALLQNSVPAPRAHVLLPSNVFCAAHRAIAVALAASAEVWVKPSRREPAFARALAAAAPGLFRLIDAGDYPWHEVLGGDHVWAYAADQTLSAVASALPASAVLHAHGPGFGVAVVDVSAERAPSFAEQARALATDCVLFEQRGCLSPRLVLAVGSAAGSAAFASELARAFESFEHSVPRGRLSLEEQAEARWYRQCAAALGPVLPAGAGVVTLSAAGEPLRVAPSGRNLHVASVADPEPALRELEPALTSAGCSTPALETAVRRLLPSARVCALGSMQRPPFDGPVDRREMPRRRPCSA